jgi:hypothetical protein
MPQVNICASRNNTIFFNLYFFPINDIIALRKKLAIGDDLERLYCKPGKLFQTRLANGF